MRRFIIVLTRALAVYAWAARAYVALIAVSLSLSVGLQVSHFSKEPRATRDGRQEID